MNSCAIHPPPGRHLALERIAPDPVPPETQLAEVALDALEELRTVVEPLAVDLALDCSDRQERWPVGGRPPRPYWYLRAMGLSDAQWIAPLYKDADVAETPRLDRQTLQGWIGRTLDQPCEGPDEVTAWAELSVRACCGRLYREHIAPTLTLFGEMGTIDAPIRVDPDGVRWACGPVTRASTPPPVDLVIRSQGSVLSLKAHFHWSWWTEAGSPERQAVDRAVDRLCAVGWELISSDLIGS